ncbi:MAG TPA: ribonuclease HII [Candidatus Omnitrophota bacterium]|nr:ribonuclease HII [Candidatus Omnitrophota bacterium]
MPPTSRLENQLHRKGIKHIAGIDEVGIGPLAGPVVAAAVILPSSCRIPGLDDSKKLSEKKRLSLFKLISERTLAIGIGIVDWETIDRINILRASHLAMKIAVGSLSIKPGHLLIDGRFRIASPISQTAIVRGDSKCASIAAASVIAKVTRDRIMEKFDPIFPEYGFKRHKGYGTREHVAAIREFGPVLIHRRSFFPVSDSPEIQIPLDF